MVILKAKHFIAIFYLFLPVNAFLYSQVKSLSVGINLLYTLESKNFPFPNSSDITLRNLNFTTEDIFSFSFSIKKDIFENFYIYANFERIKFNAKVFYPIRVENQNLAPKLLDDVLIIPVELNLGYVLPFSDDIFYYSIGGGLATYYADIKRKIGDIESKSVSDNYFYGIQTYAAFGIFLLNKAKINFEIKFRDPVINLKSKFNKTAGFWNGQKVELFRDYFYSKVNLNGLVFSLGIETFVF